MNLTIWQQFSSNHSASYTILGVFSTNEEAIAAEKRITELLQDIADWYAEDESRLYGATVEISPIETKIAAEFQIEWHEALQWFENTSIKVEKQILIIVPQYPTDSGTKDIEALLQKMGANVAIDGGYFSEFGETRYGFIEISGQPPNAKMAEVLLEKYKGTYRHAEGILEFEAFRFYPVRDFLGLIADLERAKCQDIRVKIWDKPQ